MVRVACSVCGRKGAGDSPPYNCVARNGCGGYQTMVPLGELK